MSTREEHPIGLHHFLCHIVFCKIIITKLTNQSNMKFNMFCIKFDEKNIKNLWAYFRLLRFLRLLKT